jgi:hypothetical protein
MNELPIIRLSDADCCENDAFGVGMLNLLFLLAVTTKASELRFEEGSGEELGRIWVKQADGDNQLGPFPRQSQKAVVLELLESIGIITPLAMKSKQGLFQRLTGLFGRLRGAKRQESQRYPSEFTFFLQILARTTRVDALIRAEDLLLRVPDPATASQEARILFDEVIRRHSPAESDRLTPQESERPNE